MNFILNFICNKCISKYLIYFKGCYKDAYVRDLNGLFIDYPTNYQPDMCVSYCKANYFKYAGIQNGWAL